jgi:hypothetical protein
MKNMHRHFRARTKLFRRACHFSCRRPVLINMGHSSETTVQGNGPRSISARDELSRVPAIIDPARIACILVLMVAAIAGDASAQSSGGPYRLAPVAIASGGGTLSGGSFGLSGTFGQASTAVASAPGYTFYAGIWAPLSDVIFANNFEN